MFTGKRFRTTLGLIAGTVVLAISACDSSSVSDDAGGAAVESSTDDLATVVVSDLGLSEAQRAQVVAFIDGSGAGMLEPGFTWRLAARLQATLTAEQKERLFQYAEDLPRFRRWFDRHSDGTSGTDHFRRHRAGAGFFGILTEEQIEQARAIHESYQEQIQAIRAGVEAGDITREAARERLREIHQAIRSEIEALLTDEQRAELEALRAEREARREAHREAAKLVRNEVLGLDDAGSDALDAILEEFREALAALREELRGTDVNRDRVRAAILELKQQRDAEVAELLDETAFEIFRIHEAIVLRLRSHRFRHADTDGAFGSAEYGFHEGSRFGDGG